MIRMNLARTAAAVALIAWSPLTFAQGGGCEPCRAAGGTFDEAAGICVPAKVEGLRRVSETPERAASLKRYRNTQAIGFNAEGQRLAITVYLYDRERSGADADRDEFRANISEILSAHPGSTVERKGHGSYPLAGRPTESDTAFLTWVDKGEVHGSLLQLFARDKRYFKIRATYLRPTGREGEAMKAAFASIRRMADALCLVAPG